MEKNYSLNAVGKFFGITGGGILAMAKRKEIPMPEQLIGSSVYFYAERQLPEIFKIRYEFKNRELNKKIESLKNKISSFQGDIPRLGTIKELKKIIKKMKKEIKDRDYAIKSLQIDRLIKSAESEERKIHA